MDRRNGAFVVEKTDRCDDYFFLEKLVYIVITFILYRNCVSGLFINNFKIINYPMTGLTPNAPTEYASAAINLS